MEEISTDIQTFWDHHPCGAHSVGEAIGTPGFFVEFDRFFERSYPYLFKWLDVESYRGRRVLEIGLGSGSVHQRLARVATEYVGLDLSPVTVRLNRSRAEVFSLGSKLVNGTAVRIPFPDGRFDAVVSIGCLHHVPAIETAMAEIHRVLASGGSFKGMVYNRNSFRYRVSIPLARRFSQRWRGLDADTIVRELYDGDGNPYGRVYSRDDMRRVLRDFGPVSFTQRNFHGLDLFPRYGDRIPKRLLLATLGRVAGLDLYFTTCKLRGRPPARRRRMD